MICIMEKCIKSSKNRRHLQQPCRGEYKVNKDTKFTIVMPQSDPSIADRAGIVEFIDQDNPPMMRPPCELMRP
jgi:hypothetical protein